MWLAFLLGGEVLTLFPSLVDSLSVLWGNLIPVSWISFSGLAVLILYLLHHTFELNDLRSQAVELSRHVTFLEERLRRLEGGSSPSDEKTPSGTRPPDAATPSETSPPHSGDTNA
jgi:Uncharacterized conserved protein (DUF2304)